MRPAPRRTAGGRRLPAAGLWAVLMLIAVAALPTLLAGCGAGGTEATSGPVPTTAPAAGRAAAPELAGTTLDGLALSKAAFAGRPLVLAFWGSW
jgi:hypothetical protein